MRQAAKQTKPEQRLNRLWDKQFFRYTTDVPRSSVIGREGYHADERTVKPRWVSKIADIPNERNSINEQNLFPPKLHYIHFWNQQINRKSAGTEAAIKELKDLFCNSFKRK